MNTEIRHALTCQRKTVTRTNPVKNSRCRIRAGVAFVDSGAKLRELRFLAPLLLGQCRRTRSQRILDRGRKPGGDARLGKTREVFRKIPLDDPPDASRLPRSSRALLAHSEPKRMHLTKSLVGPFSLGGPRRSPPDIRGYASTGRMRIEAHARQRMRERNVRYADLAHALSNASACTLRPNGRWRVEGADPDGDDLTAIVVLEDGLAVVTLF